MSGYRKVVKMHTQPITKIAVFFLLIALLTIGCINQNANQQANNANQNNIIQLEKPVGTLDTSTNTNEEGKFLAEIMNKMVEKLKG